MHKPTGSSSAYKASGPGAQLAAANSAAISGISTSSTWRCPKCASARLAKVSDTKVPVAVPISARPSERSLTPIACCKSPSRGKMPPMAIAYSKKAL